MYKPIRGELSKEEFNRVDKRRLKIPKRKRSRMGVMPYFSTKVDRWERAIGLDPNVMINVSAKWGDKRNGVHFKIGDAGE